MDTSAPTPSWMVGLIVIFALAAAAVFGLFLYRHTERAALEEQHAVLTGQLVPLRESARQLEDALAPMDKQIQQRRALLQPLDTFESTNRADVDRALTNNGASLKANEALQKKALTALSEAMKEAPERRQEVGREEERSFATQRDNETRRSQLRDDVEKRSQTTDAQKKKWRDEKATLDGRVTELESRVRQLRGQLDASNREFKADGTILASEARDGFVVIDRGFAHSLRTGSKFTVFTKRGGKVVSKGQIQVTEVQERISTARVLSELDGNDPLIAGDFLHNPVYDPGHVRDFSRFSASEIARFITESGGKLDQQLSVNVDFLVAGEHAEKDLDQATKLGVSIISEEQVLEFLRYDARPSALTWEYILASCKQGKRFGFAGTFTTVAESTARRVIERNGGRTSSGVGRDYAAVIVGDGAESVMAEARSLGVPVIDQLQFSRVVDPEK